MPGLTVAGGLAGAAVAGQVFDNIWQSNDAGDTHHGTHRVQEGEDGDPTRLTRAEADYVIKNPTRTYTQGDGAQVFVRTANGRSNVVIQNENGQIVTNMRNLTQRELKNLARNYEWQ